MKPTTNSNNVTTVSHTVTNNGIEVRPVEPGDDWDAYVERSDQGSVFHRSAFLDVVATHADARLHRLLGFKGQEPVGFFPVFELTRGFTTAAFSPPPDMGLSQMGPGMLNVDKLKPRKAEKRTRRFVEGCLDWIDATLDPSFVHVRTHHRQTDNRPFDWNGFELTPRYTYVLDLSPGAEALIGNFSSDARRNVRNTDDDAYEIENAGVERIGSVVDHLQTRHDNQGIHYPVDEAFVTDLARVLPDDSLHTYVLTVDGEYAGGMIILEDAETMYRWQGGARPVGDPGVPVNDLLDWHVITQGIERDRAQYDLVGANTPQLCEYKSKFGPDLVSYHVAERSTRTMRMVSELYQRFR